jgi:hypothetical protein
MDCRSLLNLAASCLLAACVEGMPGGPGAGTPEAELARQSRAMQRSIVEGAAFGAVTGGLGTYFLGDREDVPKGILIGAATGAAAGAYVGYLQNNYASNEARLERLRADVEQTNAETEATIRTMRAVLERHRRDLAALRAGAQAPSGATSAAEVQQTAEASLADMHRAIDGAESRYAAFQSTRSLNLAAGQSTGADRQIAELGQRIEQMRSIADTMAGEI